MHQWKCDNYLLPFGCRSEFTTLHNVGLALVFFQMSIILDETRELEPIICSTFQYKGTAKSGFFSSSLSFSFPACRGNQEGAYALSILSLVEHVLIFLKL